MKTRMLCWYWVVYTQKIGDIALIEGLIFQYKMTLQCSFALQVPH